MIAIYFYCNRRNPKITSGRHASSDQVWFDSRVIIELGINENCNEAIQEEKFVFLCA